MSKGSRHPWEVGDRVFRELLSYCSPDLVERVCAAGSFRRHKPDIGDLELVILEREVLVPDPADLFGGKIAKGGADILADLLIEEGILEKRKAVNGRLSSWGRENKHAIHVATGLAVDLFTSSKENHASLVLCRTGSAEFNTKLCIRAKELGLSWDPYRGFYAGRSWEVSAQRHPLEHERDAFRLLKLPYAQPANR